jgi:hypothetical protein
MSIEQPSTDDVFALRSRDEIIGFTLHENTQLIITTKKSVILYDIKRRNIAETIECNGITANAIVNGSTILAPKHKKLVNVRTGEVVATGKQISSVHTRDGGYIRLFCDGSTDDKSITKKLHAIGFFDNNIVAIKHDLSSSVIIGKDEVEIGTAKTKAFEINSNGSVTVLGSNQMLIRLSVKTRDIARIQLRKDLFDKDSKILVSGNQNVILYGRANSMPTLFIFDQNLKTLLKKIDLKRDVEPVQITMVDNLIFIAYPDALQRLDEDIPTPSLATILQNRTLTNTIVEPKTVEARRLEFKSVQQFSESWKKGCSTTTWNNQSLSTIYKNLRPEDATKFATHCVQQESREYLEKILRDKNVRQNEKIFDYIILQDTKLLAMMIEFIPDLTESQLVTALRFTLLRLPESKQLQFTFNTLLPLIINYRNVNELMLMREIVELTTAEVSALLKYLSIYSTKISDSNFSMWMKIIIDAHLQKLLSQKNSIIAIQRIKELLSHRLKNFSELSMLLGQTKVLTEGQKIPSKKDSSGLQYTVTVFK